MDVIKELLSANYPFFYFFYGKFRGLLHHYISNQEISISKSSSTLTLIHPLGHDFFGGCRNKLGWSMGIVDSSK